MTEYSSKPIPLPSPGFFLWRVNNEWQRLQREALLPLELTHVQFILITHILWLEPQEKSLTQIQLASSAKTDPMMTSQVLRTLEAKGYIKRNIHPTDSRALIISTTSLGKKIAKKAIKIVEAVDRKFFSRLGKTQKQFIHQLQKLAE